MSAAVHTHDWNQEPQRAAYRSRRDWSLRWWMMLAVIISLVFHGLLYVTFEYTGIGRSMQMTMAERAVPERVKINPELLQNQQAIQQIPDALTPANMPDIKAFEPKLDDFDKSSMLPQNQEIDLTPNVKEITNFIRADDPGDSAPAKAKMAALAEALAPQSISTPDLAQEMATVRKEVLTKAVSEKQMLLDAGAFEPKESKMDMGLVNQMNRQGQGAADAAGTSVKGFSNLDDLLGHGGKVGGSTAPILMPTDLLFEYGSDQLAEGARLSLMKLGFLIQKNPDSMFIIEGHTDSFGSEQFNLELSQRRAQAVVNWLMASLRLTTDRIQAVGMGKSKLIASPDGSIEEQSLNRRVEIKVRPRK
ncbi:MAG: OmpA family protein [Verrucomicrobiaceae bacterium]|nr:OmpA family protein [Verrucomicrobiaceae bacterium]